MTAPIKKVKGQATRARLRTWVAGFLLGMGALTVQSSFALTFEIPANSNIVGQIKTAVVHPGDTLSTIGRRFDIGGYEMKEANPGVPYLMPEEGSTVTVPQQFILPSAERKGIVVNLAELRIYYYHPDGKHVSTYPIGVGQQGWLTPMGKTTIVRKRENPWWIVPDSILENHMRNGKPIEPKWPPGPKNPLGEFAMNTGFKNIVIHGTPYPMGVGLRSSHGCMRMLPEDIRELYSMVSVGTQVTVIHEPQKIGYRGNQIYMEAHQPLREPIYSQAVSSMDSLLRKVSTLSGYNNALVRWEDARVLQQRANGYPTRIGIFQ